jgi:hypothetical protein
MKGNFKICARKNVEISKSLDYRIKFIQFLQAYTSRYLNSAVLYLVGTDIRVNMPYNITDTIKVTMSL